MGGGDFLSHLIEGDALGACNGTFVRIVRPRREDEEATRSDGIEKEVGGFEVIAEAVVGEIDDIAIVMKERVEHFLFIARDERRDHDCAFGGGIETACFVVFEGLVVAMFSGIFDPHATDVDGLAELFHENADITDGIVHPTVNLHVMLNAKEAGFEALGSEAGGVHLDIADHRLELTVRGHRTNKRLFDKDDILNPNIISGNGRNLFLSPNTISGNGQNLIRDGRNLLHRNLLGNGVNAELFDALPETTDGRKDALGHWGGDVENGMKMVRHEAVLQETDLRVTLGDLSQVVDNSFAEFRALDIGLRRVVLGTFQFSENRLTRRNYQNHVIDAYAVPCMTVFLPMPVVLLHLRQFWRKGTKNFGHVQVLGDFFAPDSISGNGRNFVTPWI